MLVGTKQNISTAIRKFKYNKRENRLIYSNIVRERRLKDKNNKSLLRNIIIQRTPHIRRFYVTYLGVMYRYSLTQIRKKSITFRAVKKS
jgi:hypothetical protein